ncbi:hypothetical protein, partial [Pseudomonas syringae group sp. J309-1]|uniref:hypothetical protein n=1 Tax=Pseudomonas syringae group sp. J309-1 TaxID=3079588 RepID=UPI0029094BA4
WLLRESGAQHPGSVMRFECGVYGALTFNHQNVLESIDLKRLQDLSILVDIVSIWGIGGTIRCNHVAVGAVTNLLS